MIDSKLEPQPYEGSGDKNVQQARRSSSRHAAIAYPVYCQPILHCHAARPALPAVSTYRRRNTPRVSTRLSSLASPPPASPPSSRTSPNQA